MPSSTSATRGSDLATCEYDALGRRIRTYHPTTYTDRHLYYSMDWQVIEERQGAVIEPRTSGAPCIFDAMVLRDRRIRQRCPAEAAARGRDAWGPAEYHTTNVGDWRWR